MRWSDTCFGLSFNFILLSTMNIMSVIMTSREEVEWILPSFFQALGGLNKKDGLSLANTLSNYFSYLTANCFNTEFLNANNVINRFIEFYKHLLCLIPIPLFYTYYITKKKCAVKTEVLKVNWYTKWKCLIFYGFLFSCITNESFQFIFITEWKQFLHTLVYCIVITIQSLWELDGISYLINVCFRIMKLKFTFTTQI